MTHEPGGNEEKTRTLRFQLVLRYDTGAEGDPARWRFALSDLSSHEQVGGVGIAGLPEAVALLASRAVPVPNGPQIVED